VHHELHITATKLSSGCIKSYRQGVWKLTPQIFNITSLIRIEVILILFLENGAVLNLAVWSMICKNVLHTPLE